MGKVQCKECGVVLESTFRHDYKTCGCPNETMIDGGNDYLRYGGKDLSKVLILKSEDLNNTSSPKRVMVYYITLSSDEPSVPFELAMELAAAISELKYNFPNINIKLKINDSMEIKNIVNEKDK